MEPTTLTPIQISDIWGKVLYTAKAATSLAAALVEAVAAGTNLWYASLDRLVMPYGARLDGASLDGASLVDARLDGARLVDARLDGASLVGASLVDARLDDASLVGARLVGARLDGARLVGASLVDARLDGASLGKKNDLLVVAGSKVAYAGPVGNADRMVSGFIVQEKDSAEPPFLVLRCGCFIGTEPQYRAKVAEMLESERGNGGREVFWNQQRLVGLNLIRTLVMTWGVKGYVPLPTPGDEAVRATKQLKKRCRPATKKTTKRKAVSA